MAFWWGLSSVLPFCRVPSLSPLLLPDGRFALSLLPSPQLLFCSPPSQLRTPPLLLCENRAYRISSASQRYGHPPTSLCTHCSAFLCLCGWVKCLCSWFWHPPVVQAIPCPCAVEAEPRMRAGCQPLPKCPLLHCGFLLCSISPSVGILLLCLLSDKMVPSSQRPLHLPRRAV